MDETSKTEPCAHFDIIENFEHRTWPVCQAPSVLPDETPTEHVKHVDLIVNRRLDKYLTQVKKADVLMVNWKRAHWLETLEEIKNEKTTY